MYHADGGMESEENSFDEETVNCESSPSSHEDKCYYTGPLLSNKTSALVDGSSQQNVARHDLIDKFKSYSSERKPFKKMAGSTLQSAGVRQDCLPNEPSAVLYVRRSSYIPSGAGKGHQLCTGCDECIGSAAQVCSCTPSRQVLNFFILSCQTMSIMKSLIILFNTFLPLCCLL